MKGYLKLLSAVFLTFALFAGPIGCSSSSSAPQEDGTPTIVELTDGMTGVALDATIKYSFAGEVDASTVTEESLYIVPYFDMGGSENISASASYSEDICDGDAADFKVEGDTSCEDDACLITPTNGFFTGLQYYLCIKSDIKLADESAVTPASLGFTVVGDTADYCAELFAGPCNADEYEGDGEPPDDLALSYSSLVSLLSQVDDLEASAELYAKMGCFYVASVDPEAEQCMPWEILGEVFGGDDDDDEGDGGGGGSGDDGGGGGGEELPSYSFSFPETVGDVERADIFRIWERSATTGIGSLSDYTPEATLSHWDDLYLSYDQNADNFNTEGTAFLYRMRYAGPAGDDMFAGGTAGMSARTDEYGNRYFSNEDTIYDCRLSSEYTADGASNGCGNPGSKIRIQKEADGVKMYLYSWGTCGNADSDFVQIMTASGDYDVTEPTRDTLFTFGEKTGDLTCDDITGTFQASTTIGEGSLTDWMNEETLVEFQHVYVSPNDCTTDVDADAFYLDILENEQPNSAYYHKNIFFNEINAFEDMNGHLYFSTYEGGKGFYYGDYVNDLMYGDGNNQVESATRIQKEGEDVVMYQYYFAQHINDVVQEHAIFGQKFVKIADSGLEALDCANLEGLYEQVWKSRANELPDYIDAAYLDESGDLAIDLYLDATCVEGFVDVRLLDGAEGGTAFSESAELTAYDDGRTYNGNRTIGILDPYKANDDPNTTTFGIHIRRYGDEEPGEASFVLFDWRNNGAQNINTFVRFRKVPK